jgi:hypothetical protein
VLAVADGVAFGQLKGSYYKLKIKDSSAGISVGSICTVKLQKLVKDKLTALFVGLEQKEATTAAQRALEHRAQQIYDSVQEEGAKDVASAKQAKSENDLEQMIIKQRNQT